MDPFHFSCPHCSSRLRVREKLYVGRQVDCPECGDTLLIVDLAGELGVERVARKPGEEKRETASESAKPVDSMTPGVPLPSRGRLQWFLADRRRALFALGAAAAMLVTLIAVIVH